MSPELDKLMLAITACRKLIWEAINEYDRKVREHETLMRLEQEALHERELKIVAKAVWDALSVSRLPWADEDVEDIIKRATGRK